MPSSIGLFTSFACSACSLRGSAKNPIPNAFRKQKAASAPVSASAAAPTGRTILVNVSFKPKPRSSDCRVSHSLTKPLNGGRAEIASTPIRKRMAVVGIFLMRPPSFSVFFVCVENIMEPAPMNNNPLNTE